MHASMGVHNVCIINVHKLAAFYRKNNPQSIYSYLVNGSTIHHRHMNTAVDVVLSSCKLRLFHVQYFSIHLD